MTLSDLTPEKIALFEAERKAEHAKQQQLDAEYTATIQKEKQRAEQYWQNKRSNLPTGNPRTDQKCGDCGATIPAHTPAKYSIGKTVYGSNVGLKRVYHCQKCIPIKEAQ